jgi:hypothetical protein
VTGARGMVIEALWVALPAAALFCGLVLMGDRKRGAVVAQGAAVVAVVPIFVSILVEQGVAGIAARDLAALGIALVSASVAGMLYHLYLGRFDSVWAARGVFTAIFLGLSAVFSLTILSLI